MSKITYRTAVRDALGEELERDEKVVLLGEDIAPGGVFNTTPGLVERFGTDRVIDTPISEMAFMAGGFGAAVRGMRPVVEIMFGDFIALPLDVLCNQASKYWYVSNEQASVPLTVRTAVGAGVRLGSFHSQTPTSWFLNLPGLKLVAPTTPADAKALIRTAVEDDNPVVIFEHKTLYSTKGEVPEEIERVPIGKAAVRREGGDVTIVAALAAVARAEAAAATLEEQHGIAAQVIDLRSLRPLDAETITAAAAATGKLVVVEDGPPLGGYAAEVIGLAAEAVPGLRVARVCSPDIPVPFAPALEDAYLPNADRVVAAIRGVCDQVGAGEAVRA